MTDRVERRRPDPGRCTPQSVIGAQAQTISELQAELTRVCAELVQLEQIALVTCPACHGTGWHDGRIGSRICEGGCAGAGVVRRQP